MPATLAFDVYGTLIDTDGVVEKLRWMVGDKAQAFSHTWREKQLEYSFRRGLMQLYEDFSVCTSEALDYTCIYHGVPLTEAQKSELLALYRILPTFEDVREGLALLSGAGHSLFAFSNGTREDVNALLDNVDIRSYFLDVISVEAIKSYKPNPAVYSHFLRETGCVGCDAWLVSSNPFDIIGAISAGMRGIWLKRSEEKIFDPWGVKPTITLSSLREIEGQLARYLSKG